MGLADRVGDWSLHHPDRILSVVGGLGGFILGAANLDITTGLAAGLVAGLFTLLIANLSPVDPALGPHH
jgi:hypothetical protein